MKDDIEEFLHPGLLILEEYDCQYKQALLVTLREYLLSGQSISKTIKKLDIHRNSLLYRLNRIREIAGTDLNDGDELLKLILHFRIREVLS